MSAISHTTHEQHEVPLNIFSPLTISLPYPQTLVGLFWECDGHRDSIDSGAFAQVLLEITKSISSTNFVDYACALACAMRPQEQQYLVDLGFEV